MSNNLSINIKSKIYEIRGKQVMLDSDLAIVYSCANGTKTINQAVSRNKERFPEDFYFKLTKYEFDNLKSHSGTSSSNYGEVEILNVILDRDEIIKLLNKNGYYKAYHMSKVDLISIVLNDTLSLDEITSLIDKSYSLVK